MNSKNHNDLDQVLKEVRITRDYFNQVSDSIHQQIWEVRTVAQQTRQIVLLLLGLVSLLLIILCWKFIAAIFLWLTAFILLFYKFIEPAIDKITIDGVLLLLFWLVVTFIAGFLSIFLTRVTPTLFKIFWEGSNMQFRTRQILNKGNDITTKSEKAEAGNDADGSGETTYSQRMNTYLQEAQSYLEKQKEARLKDK